MRLPLLACLLLLTLAARPLQAAESYDNCTGYVDSLPATLAAQGTWCLRGDLATAIGTGSAITIAANNVTLACNGFKIGGLGAGAGTQAFGIRADGRFNLTVRDCSIRGFANGIYVSASAGVRILDNLLDGNHYIGMQVQAAGSLVQGNSILDTGGSLLAPSAGYGIIVADGTDVIDNSITGVIVSNANGSVYGIFSFSNDGAVIAGNRVRGLASLGSGGNYAISDSNSPRIVFLENILQDSSGRAGAGIDCSEPGGIARGNTINGFQFALVDCVSNANVVN